MTDYDFDSSGLVFTEAARDVDAEVRAELLIRGKIAAAAFWPYLADAASETEFGHRLALVEDRLARQVPTDVLEPVQASLAADWKLLRVARQQERQAAAQERGEQIREHITYVVAAHLQPDQEFYDQQARKWVTAASSASSYTLPGRYQVPEDLRGNRHATEGYQDARYHAANDYDWRLADADSFTLQHQDYQQGYGRAHDDLKAGSRHGKQAYIDPSDAQRYSAYPDLNPPVDNGPLQGPDGFVVDPQPDNSGASNAVIQQRQLTPGQWTVTPGSEWPVRPNAGDPSQVPRTAAQLPGHLRTILQTGSPRWEFDALVTAYPHLRAFAGEGIVPTPGPNPNYFSQGSDGLAGPPSFPENPSGQIEPKTDNRIDDLYGAVPPQVSPGSAAGTADGQGYSRQAPGSSATAGRRTAGRIQRRPAQRGTSCDAAPFGDHPADVHLYETDPTFGDERPLGNVCHQHDSGEDYYDSHTAGRRPFDRTAVGNIDPQGWFTTRREGYPKAETDCGHKFFDNTGRCNECGYSAADEQNHEDWVRGTFGDEGAERADALLGDNHIGPTRYSSRTAGFDDSHVTHYVGWARSQGKDPDDVETLKTYERQPGIGRSHTNFLADQLYIGGGDSDWRRQGKIAGGFGGTEPTFRPGDRVQSFRGEDATIHRVYPSQEPGKSHRVQVRWVDPAKNLTWDGKEHPEGAGDERAYYESVFSHHPDSVSGVGHMVDQAVPHSRDIQRAYSSKQAADLTIRRIQDAAMRHPDLEDKHCGSGGLSGASARQLQAMVEEAERRDQGDWGSEYTAARLAATDGRIVGHCDHCRNPVRYHTNEQGVDELRHLHNNDNRCSNGQQAMAGLERTSMWNPIDKRVDDVQPGDVVIAGGRYMPITQVSFHAPGEHPESPIKNELHAVQLHTDNGSRWYGSGRTTSTFHPDLAGHEAVPFKLDENKGFTASLDRVHAFFDPTDPSVIVVTADETRNRPTLDHPAGVPDEFDANTWDNALTQRPLQSAQDRHINTPTQARDPIPVIDSSPRDNDLDEDRNQNSMARETSLHEIMEMN